MIKSFSYNNEFLSNFYEHPVTFRGVTFRNSEAAFQSGKSNDPLVWREFASLSGKAAKSHGKKIQLRPDWEDVKVKVMYVVLLNKFSDPFLKKKLLATGDQILVEGNSWHDNFWGSCVCKKCKNSGQNILGKLLMLVRDRLRSEES